MVITMDKINRVYNCSKQYWRVLDNIAHDVRKTQGHSIRKKNAEEFVVLCEYASRHDHLREKELDEARINLRWALEDMSLQERRELECIYDYGMSLRAGTAFSFKDCAWKVVWGMGSGIQNMTKAMYTPIHPSLPPALDKIKLRDWVVTEDKVIRRAG